MFGFLWIMTMIFQWLSWRNMTHQISDPHGIFFMNSPFCWLDSQYIPNHTSLNILNPHEESHVFFKFSWESPHFVTLSYLLTLFLAGLQAELLPHRGAHRRRQLWECIRGGIGAGEPSSFNGILGIQVDISWYKLIYKDIKQATHIWYLKMSENWRFTPMVQSQLEGWTWQCLFTGLICEGFFPSKF